MSKITEDQLWSDYKPVKNHLNPNASFCGYMFETYGPELEFVQGCETNKIWSIIEGDTSLFYSAGCHQINLIGYVITELPWKTGNEQIECE